MDFLNSHHRFHKCITKECNVTYDTLKLMEKQKKEEKDIKKVEAKKDAKDTLNANIQNKNDKLIRYICLIYFSQIYLNFR